MKKIRIFLVLLLSMLFAFLFIGCNESEPRKDIPKEAREIPEITKPTEKEENNFKKTIEMLNGKKHTRVFLKNDNEEGDKIEYIDGKLYKSYTEEEANIYYDAKLNKYVSYNNNNKTIYDVTDEMLYEVDEINFKDLLNTLKKLLSDQYKEFFSFDKKRKEYFIDIRRDQEIINKVTDRYFNTKLTTEHPNSKAEIKTLTVTEKYITITFELTGYLDDDGDYVEGTRTDTLTLREGNFKEEKPSWY